MSKMDTHMMAVDADFTCISPGLLIRSPPHPSPWVSIYGMLFILCGYCLSVFCLSGSDRQTWGHCWFLWPTVKKESSLLSRKGRQTQISWHLSVLVSNHCWYPEGNAIVCFTSISQISCNFTFMQL